MPNYVLIPRAATRHVRAVLNDLMRRGTYPCSKIVDIQPSPLQAQVSQSNRFKFIRPLAEDGPWEVEMDSEVASLINDTPGRPFQVVESTFDYQTC